MAAVKTAKKELRQRIKQALSNVSAEQMAQQTSQALAILLGMREYQEAKRVSVYLSMPVGEIATAGIVNDALRKGKNAFVPYIYKRSTQMAGQPLSIMDMLQLQSIEDYQSFTPDKWGIPSIPESSVAQRRSSFGGFGRSDGVVPKDMAVDAGLDLVVMPGMAFDEEYGRLGHGKGFYDFFLQRCFEYSKQDKNARMPFLVGLALKEQLLPPGELVPMDATDWRLDALITGDGRLVRRQCA